MSRKQIVSVVVGLGVLFWEHFARRYEWNYGPVIGLTQAYTKGKDLFWEVGRLFALGSSYLYEMQLKEIGITIWGLLVAILKLLFVPFWSFYGYAECVATYAGSEILVYLGSVLLLILTLYLLIRFQMRIPLLNRLPQFSLAKHGFLIPTIALFSLGIYHLLPYIWKIPLTTTPFSPSSPPV